MTRPFEAADVAEWRGGWRIVLGAGIGLGTGVALYLYVASLFVAPITAEFGWTRGDLGVAGAIAYIVAAISLSAMGRVLDRFGFRRVVLVCVPTLALVYVALTAIQGSYALYVALICVAGIVGGGTAAIAYTRPVIAAFDRQRGLALGVSAAGVSLSALIAPPIIGLIVGAYGWRAGVYVLASLMVLVGLPLALWLIGRARDDVAPEQVRAVLTDAPDARRLAGGELEVSLTQALRGARFWLIAMALIAINIPGSGVVSQLAPMITDKGMSEATAGVILSVYALGLLIGRLTTGFALDRAPAAIVAALMTAIPAIGTLLLLLPTPSFAVAAFAVVLIGLQQGSEIDLLAYFVSRGFGFKHYSSIFGMIAMAGALSTATSLVLFGKVHDLTGNYDIALIIGAAGFLIGAAAFFATGRLESR